MATDLHKPVSQEATTCVLVCVDVGMDGGVSSHPLSVAGYMGLGKDVEDKQRRWQQLQKVITGGRHVSTRNSCVFTLTTHDAAALAAQAEAFHAAHAPIDLAAQPMRQLIGS